MDNNIINIIISFINYENIVKSGCINIIDLCRALNNEHKTYSFIKYVNASIKKGKIYYLPDIIFEKIRYKLPKTRDQYIFLTLDFIVKFKPKWYDICNNKSLNEEIIDTYKDKLNWIEISKNFTLSLDFIDKYKDKLSWKYMSYNRSLTQSIYDKYIGKWDHFIMMIYNRPNIIRPKLILDE